MIRILAQSLMGVGVIWCAYAVYVRLSGPFAAFDANGLTWSGVDAADDYIIDRVQKLEHVALVALYLEDKGFQCRAQYSDAVDSNMARLPARKSIGCSYDYGAGWLYFDFFVWRVVANVNDAGNVTNVRSTRAWK